MNRNFSFLFSLLLVQQLAAQDLSSKLSVNTSDLVAGNLYHVSSVIRNTGTKAASGYEVAYYASKNETLGPNDVLLYKKSSLTTLPGATTHVQGEVVLPKDLQPGTYHLIMKADISNKVAETNEKNNESVFKVSVVAPRVDLYFSYVKPLKTVLVPGEDFIITASEDNAGLSLADDHAVSFYLSKDKVQDSKDVLLALSEVGQVGPGDGVYHEQTLTIPDHITPGTYYLIGKTDTRNVIKETNEKNNTSAVQIEIESPFTDPSAQRLLVYNYGLRIAPGTRFNVVGIAENAGNTLVSDLKLKFYFSEDAIVSADDSLLAASNAGTLNPSDTVSSYKNIKIPSNTQPGNYYILFEVSGSTPADANLENNVKYMTIQVEQVADDVSVSSINLSGKKASPGDEVFPRVALRNNGPYVVTTSVGYYLSANSQLDSSDVLLKETEVEVYPGYDYNQDHGVWINPQTSYGNYFLIVKADNKNILPETDENNNLSFTDIALAERNTDLTISFTDKTPIVLKPGSSINTLLVNANRGTTYAKPNNVFLFLSKDTLYNSPEISYVHHIHVDGIEGGDSVELPSSGFIDQYVEPGEYYLLATTDLTYPVITEINENNNTDYRKVIVLPYDVDYTVTADIYGSNQLIAGQYAELLATEFNTGSERGATHDIVFYLSKDSIPQNSEIIGAVYSDVLGGSYYETSASVYIPYQLASGNYFLIARADGFDAVKETNESNNLSFIPVFVQKPYYDLRTEADAETFSTFPGGSVTKVLTIYNNGTEPVYEYTTGFYISMDSVLDESDWTLAQEYGSQVNPGESNGLYGFLQIPENFAPGSYYLISMADSYHYYNESSETNNIHIDRIYIQSQSTSQRTSGIESQKNVTGSAVYPNPTKGTVYFPILNEADEVEVSDASGAVKLIMKTSDLNNQSLDLGRLQAGLYVFKLKKEGAIVSIQKVVLEK